ncbi:unnamed protein product [Tetraodon nigroviridis]|uniref:(spotted green pufferfish) hypothetical protein n=1 Tax=Tetraodon nigroviridis TaxID=99883 RepID=Q4SPY7_TETNG|nr:unnamed protein product [Tetraodon nigroviridis]
MFWTKSKRIKTLQVLVTVLFIFKHLVSFLTACRPVPVVFCGRPSLKHSASRDTLDLVLHYSTISIIILKEFRLQAPPATFKES